MENNKIRPPRELGNLHPSALEIASGGVFSNTSLLSAVYYYIADLQGPRSTNLTVTAVMTGGTQLVEGAHLPGGDTRFCRESSKSRFFGGEIIKFAL